MPFKLKIKTPLIPPEGKRLLPPVNLKLSLLGRFKLTETLNLTELRLGLRLISFLLHENNTNVSNKMIFLTKILPKTFNCLYLIYIPIIVNGCFFLKKRKKNE